MRHAWRIVALLTLVFGLSAALADAPGARAEDQPLPQAITHQHVNAYEAIADVADGTIGESAYKNPPSPICSTTSTSASNVNTDCEGVAPHNETSLAVNPTNPANIIASANDYQLRVSSGGTVNETVFSRAHVSFDGGRTWTTYPIAYNGYAATGDPAVAFDADGTAYLATLGFIWSQGGPTGVNPDILVATSRDGGRSWSSPAKVATGSGSWGSPGLFNDKEFIAAWGHGNAIVTWTVFNDGIGGSYINSPIYAAVTHDGGRTWSTGVEISGSAPFCVGAQGGHACDQDQGSIPTVTPDGRVFVGFLNTYDVDPASLGYGRDQYLVVEVDPATGKRVAGPFQVAKLVDGVRDYPVNASGRQTYQDSQFRTWSAGNLTADPTRPGHLALAWSDMRNSQLPAPPDPYRAQTNSDVVVSQSFDYGRTWSAPVAIGRAGDQFMPWAAYDAAGLLRIGYFDRSYDRANHKYGYTLSTESRPGSLRFGSTQLTTVLSDPTRDDRWFSGLTVNSAFPHPTQFLGDYSGIAARPDGGVVALWTDMRLTVDILGRSGAGEDAFYATAR